MPELEIFDESCAFDEALKKILATYDSLNYVDSLSKEDGDRLISALCFVSGYEVSESTKIRNRMDEIRKREDDPTDVELIKTFHDFYDAFAHLKLCDEALWQKKKTDSARLMQFTINLKDSDPFNNKKESLFRVAYDLQDNCRAARCLGLSSYSEFVIKIGEWSLVTPEQISNAVAAICKKYYFGDGEVDLGEDLTKEQLMILKQVIFMLLAVETRRNPAAIILNAMAIDLIIGGKKWNELIVAEKISMAVLKKSSFVKEGEDSVAEGGMMIPMTARNSVRISESLNLRFKQFLPEVDFLTFLGVAANNSEQEIQNFIKAQGDFFRYWVDFKWKQLEKNCDRNSLGLKIALDKVQKFNGKNFKKFELAEAAEAYQNLIKEFLSYFYQGVSLSQCVKTIRNRVPVVRKEQEIHDELELEKLNEELAARRIAADLRKMRRV